MSERSPERLAFKPLAAPSSLRATVRPPGSKSITNRACICAALADGESTLEGALDSEDTQVMMDSLRRLGLGVQLHEDQLTIGGAAGKMPHPAADLFCANSGTTIRFLTAMLATVGGRYRLDGVRRMRQRPIADLVHALRQLGGSVAAADNGCPPISIDGPPLPGGAARVSGSISSQYLSGLLMAAPAASGNVRLDVQGELVSRPYVAMTLTVMRDFGVQCDADESLSRFEVAPQGYRARRYPVEPDASAASYFWAAAAITGGEVTVDGLTFGALQGDVDFCRVLEQMGCSVNEDRQRRSLTIRGAARGGQPLRGVDVDMNAISDTVQSLAAVALFAAGPTRVRGVAHNRHKETDRIGDLARELRKFGAQVDELEDGMVITPPSQVTPADVETYNDHRMAMSLALPGLMVDGVAIRNPGCTAKTYPGYWEDWERLRGAEVVD